MNYAQKTKQWDEGNSKFKTSANSLLLRDNNFSNVIVFLKLFN